MKCQVWEIKLAQLSPDITTTYNPQHGKILNQWFTRCDHFTQAMLYNLRFKNASSGNKNIGIPRFNIDGILFVFHSCKFSAREI